MENDGETVIFCLNTPTSLLSVLVDIDSILRDILELLKKLRKKSQLYLYPTMGHIIVA